MIAETPSTAQAWRMRAAIARDQTSHWRRLFWEPARTKAELERRERLWFFWGSLGWQAENQARWKERSNVHER